ncbi:MAG TPA: hydroxysqualene dehydroxylase HpnE [Noviherbaspirillum sp.]|uniref:hydroxysqualene dehydroxylase HpnE n=1 Tax=Noviherbaspirillum sp. TaxID=1926288 RepID=UPI002B4993AA|nr:hydroxysqualene dehydroxylase HpnE [Noviherbaspirillum sp.]HJV84900.1 hydroxysqualene dehydroxylase HpnE [Noviherbaspirillum sp.]
MREVAVIGGGWAGCAAAVELARRGANVTLFEAARSLGGRARGVEINGCQLDNGQHILLGAYTETLRLMRVVGMQAGSALLRLPLQMRYPSSSAGMDFVAPRLPAPLHVLAGLLRASGLSREDKLSLARFSTTARWMDWQLNIDCTVTELLDRYDQTDRLIRLMWRPLCIAALNTPPERASAQIFLNVLRDSLGARRAASDMLLPRFDMTQIFPKHAASFIQRHGGSIRCGQSVGGIGRDGDRWRLDVTNTPEASEAKFDGVVVATQATRAASLLDGVAAVSLPDFDYEPISTCYLQYAPDISLAQPLFALLDDAASGQWGQFVFDRGQLDARHAGLLSVVVSASADAVALGHETTATAIAMQLATVFQQPALAHPQWTKMISEKRATFSCTPALARPGNQTGCENLVIAGDYTASDYPATLESAVRSGVEAAKLLLKK